MLDKKTTDSLEIAEGNPSHYDPFDEEIAISQTVYADFISPIEEIQE